MGSVQFGLESLPLSSCRHFSPSALLSAPAHWSGRHSAADPLRWARGGVWRVSPSPCKRERKAVGVGYTFSPVPPEPAAPSLKPHQPGRLCSSLSRSLSGGSVPSGRRLEGPHCSWGAECTVSSRLPQPAHTACYNSLFIKPSLISQCDYAMCFLLGA